MRKGDLGDAVRASMSFPVMFKPIEIDSVLTYDGGIYNNFPTDVMRQDFKPDIIIGSIVSSNASRPNEKDLISQLESMIMQKTDYTLPDSLGILMRFRYTDVSLMDFNRLKELHDIGYNRTISLIDSIKGRIHRRVNADNVRLRRLIFKSNIPELRFRKITVEGANPQQQKFIKKEFHEDENELFTYEDFKTGYFRLLSDNIISEIIPHAEYDAERQAYDLHLKVKMEDNFSIRVGGSVSSSTSNQMYFGLSYQDLNFYSKEFMFDGQLGKVYNNLQFTARIDFSTKIPTSYKFIASISTFDYFKKDKLFSGSDKPAFTKKKERFAKLKVALPFLSKKKAEFGVGIANIEDQYVQSDIVDFNDHKRFDKSTYLLFGGSIYFGGSSLNARQFANKGSSEDLIAQLFIGNEHLKSGKSPELNSTFNQKHQWLQISYKRNDYYPLSPHFILGSHIEAYYSSKNFSQNYTATLLTAGEFTPTPHSCYSYNEAFRANQYIALGIKPIYQINKIFQVRTEFYGFMPIFPIKRNALNMAYYGKSFSQLEYIGELSVVCALPFGAISAYVNHYSSPKKEWNFGITLGWQLFNERFIE